MNCLSEINTKEFAALTALENYCGGNTIRFSDYLSSVLKVIDKVGHIGFNEDFTAYWAQSFVEPLNLITSNPTDVKNAILNYYNDIAKPDGRTWNREKESFDSITTFGYTNVDARNEAVAAIANYMLDLYREAYVKGENIEDLVKNNDFIDKAIRKFNSGLARSLSIAIYGDESQAKIIFNQLIKPNNKQYLSDLVESHKDKMTLQLMNRVACYYEYNTTDYYTENNIANTTGVPTTNPREEFLKKVAEQKDVQALHLYRQIETTTNESSITEETSPVEESTEEEEEAIEGNNNPDVEDSPMVSDFDNTIANFENKRGLYTDFMKHLSLPVRSILGSLREMVSVEDANTGDITQAFDTNNYLGIPKCMDANRCATVLYHFGNFENPTRMVESILSIAQRLPGMAGFVALHKMLQNNLSLQYDFYRTFKKLVTSRARNTKTADAHTAITFSGYDGTTEGQIYNKMYSAIKANIPTVDIISLWTDVDTLMSTYGKISGELDYKTVVAISTELTKVYQKLFPFVDERSMRNFILYANEGNRADNVKTMLERLNRISSGANGSLQLYNKQQADIARAIKQNAIARHTAMEERRVVRKNELIDLSQFYTDFVDKSVLSPMHDFAHDIAPYTTVYRSLNEADVHGHQTSSVINDSMISSIVQTLSSELNKYTTDEAGNRIYDENAPIVQLANHRSQSKQYDFSNILLEHTEIDNNGQERIINLGIFRKDDTGKWIPTEYASQLIKASLYEGVVNSQTGTAVSRSEMSRTDYLASSWHSFFGTTEEEINNIKVATYFMRCPSDAPNTDVIRAPRYDCSDFLRIANQEEIDAKIKAIWTNALAKNAYKGENAASISEVTFYKSPRLVYNESKLGNDTSAFIAHLQADENRPVDIPIAPTAAERYKLQDDTKTRVRFAFRYTNDVNSDDNKDNVYVMEGIYYNHCLHNATFQGFVEDTQTADSYVVRASIFNTIRNQYATDMRNTKSDENGAIYELNTNHVVYKQMRNLFMQELRDMVTAGQVMFQTVTDADGFTSFSYDAKTHKPLLNHGFTNTDHNGLHPTYHFAEADDANGRKIYEMSEDGVTIHLLGNVFHSNRFISYDKNEEHDGHKGYCVNFGERILEEAFYMFNRQAEPGTYLRFKTIGDEVVIDITPEQEAIINKYLTEFVLAYLNDSYDQLQNVRQQIDMWGNDSNNDVNWNMAIDYSMNYWLAYIGFDDLFEGNSKFYKNSQTFLKRAKEVQAGGVSMGMTDYTRSIQSQHLPINSPLTGITFGKDGKKTVQMYDGFSAVTIYNTVKTDDKMLQCLEKHLTDKEAMKNAVLTQEEAHALLYGEDGKGGYQNTTVNDGQSYITFDEWIRRITGRGQLAQYKDLIDKVLDESQPLTASDLRAFIQVQKNFYYDQYYNAFTKTISPRQIKNAEFVLVPRLVRGTELEKVAELMEKLGIDQLNTVETSKSGQGSRFTIWDETGNLTQEIRADLENLDTPNYEPKSLLWQSINNPQTKEYFNYNYLYTQQETKQHVDSTNKIGIQIAKKITDNINENDPNCPQHLKDIKKEYQRLFSKNIEEGYLRLMDRLNVKLKEGTIQLVDGQVVGLDYKQLFDMIYEEWSRLGADENTKNFCTIGDNNPIGNRPKVPMCFTYNGTKAENVLQSIFNHNITRQLLPGFHAAQIAGLGFKSFRDQGIQSMSESDYRKDRTANPLAYHFEIDESGDYHYKIYAEIMLPASAFGIDRNAKRYKGLSKEEQDKKILDDLKEQGLDTIIGYRIPTEGKQSICYMKVTQLLDDAYGSTIVVPDAWVSQTGADFDIDSVYSIQYKTYKLSNGLVKKIKYQKEFDVYNWMQYVANKTHKRHEGITQEVYDSIREEAKLQTKAEQKQARKEKQLEIDAIETEVWNNLDDSSKAAIRGLHQLLNERYGKAISKQKYQAQLENEIELLERRKNDFKDIYDSQDIQHIDEYIAIRQDILSNLLGNSPFDYDAVKSEKTQELLNRYRTSRIEAYKADAEAAGLMSLEDFLAEKNGENAATEEERIDAIDEANSLAARQNQMIEDMVAMLTDPFTLKENLSRSNFDKISASIKKYTASNFEVDQRRAARSPYNPFSQALYHEDAMSGRSIKGMSVFRDTLCSVMNTVNGVVTKNAAIKVAYPKSKYNQASLRARFDEVVDGGAYWIVTHNTFGWSKDNQNVDGEFITTYSSQTTAHCLDAMKAGQVPNVNEYTFPVYKTIVDLGSNFDTAVSFIMLPGITRIVEAYSRINSIYLNARSRDVIQQAIHLLADELGVEHSPMANTETVVKAINSYYQDAIINLGIFGDEIFATTNEAEIGKIALNADLNDQRLGNKGIFAGNDETPISIDKKHITLENGSKLTVKQAKLLFDLFTILQFNKINKLASDAQQAARVLSPDKFGAKQTVYSTRKVFEDIISLINDNRDEEGNTPFRLQYNGKNVLEAVYPNMEITETSTTDDLLERITNNKRFVKDSAYPMLAAYLKYATIPSIMVNQTMFDTQRPEFRDLIFNDAFGLKSALSFGRHLTEPVVKDFSKYVVNHLIISRSRFLQAPLGYTKGKGFTYTDYVPGTENLAEGRRIRGLGYPSAIATFNDELEEVVFTCQDLNDPTQDEINAFAALSPAQKVIYVQQNFRNLPFFSYFQADTHNTYFANSGKALHSIFYNSQYASSDAVLKEFDEMFTSEHPFIALAAADLVKYAFYVEGNAIGMRNVTKAIHNEVLVQDNPISGTGIVSDFENTMTDLGSILTNDMKDNADENDTNLWSLSPNEQIVENYIRSHYKTCGIAYRHVKYDKERHSWEINPNQNEGVIMFNLSIPEHRSLASKYNVIARAEEGKQLETNKYVRLGFGNNDQLYYIAEDRKLGVDSTVYLIPLIPLASTENSTFSTIDGNNAGLAQRDYYTSVLKEYLDTVPAHLALNGTIDQTVFKEILDRYDKSKYQPIQTNTDSNTSPIRIENFETNDEFKGLVNRINEWSENRNRLKQPCLYVWNKPLGKYVRGFGPANGDTYQVNGQLYHIAKVDVNRVLQIHNGTVRWRNSFKKYNQLLEELDVVAKYFPDGKIPVVNGKLKFGEIYSITPVEEITPNVDENSEMYSTMLDEAVVQMSISVGTRSHSQEDPVASQLYNNFRQLGVINKTSEIGPYVEDVLGQTSKYIKITIDDYLANLKQYWYDNETQKYYPINSDETIKACMQNPVLLRQYMKDILKQDQILRQFELITHIDENEENPDLSEYIKIAKQSLHELQISSLVDNALTKLAKAYYDGSTNHPTIKAHISSVLSGFHSTNWMNAMFNGIGETSNPVIQIAMKNFQTQFSAKERMAERNAEEFVKHMKDIEKRAKAAGKKLDMSNIIDEYGRFKNFQSEQFIKDRDALRKAHNNAIISFGKGSEEELKTRLAYDEWKAKYTEQPVIKEYYDQRNKMLRELLYGYDKKEDVFGKLEDGTFGPTGEYNIVHVEPQIEVLVRYETLRAKLKEVLSKQIPGKLNPDLDKKISEIKDSIMGVRYGFDDVLYPDIDAREGAVENNDPTKKKYNEMRLAINNYISGLNALTQKYFVYDANPMFEENLKKNLQIIAKFESSDAPASSYADNKEYLAAKDWMYFNVDAEPVWDTDEALAEIRDALANTGHGSQFKVRHEIINNPKYKRKNGRFDPTLVSQEDRKRLYDEETAYYGTNHRGFYSSLVDDAPNWFFNSDWNLLSNKALDGPVWTKEFYELVSMGKDKLSNQDWRETITAINRILAPYYNTVTKKIDLFKIPNTKKGIAQLKKLAELYDKLDEIRCDIKSPLSKKQRKKVITNINTYVDKSAVDEQYDLDINNLKQLQTGDYKSALLRVIKRVPLDGESGAAANSYLYGRLQPKKEYIAQFTAPKATERQNVLNKYFEYVPKPEFNQKKADILREQGETAMREWLRKNMVFNPYTRSLQPLSIWMTRKPKTEKFNYYPKYPQTNRQVRKGIFSQRELDNGIAREFLDNEIEDFDVTDEITAKLEKDPKLYIKEFDFSNPNYKEGTGHVANFRDNKDGKYATNNNMNEFEREALNYIQTTLQNCTHTVEGKAYLNNGWAPVRAKQGNLTVKGTLMEVAKLAGYNNETYDPNNWYETVDYAKDRPMPMPMLGHLKGHNLESFGKFPVRQEGQSEQAYKEEVKKWEENKHRIEMDTHKRLLDTDWVDVFHDYIIQAGRYNATQDGKYELFFAKKLLEKYGHYITAYNKKGQKVYKRNQRNTDDESTDYLRTPDTNLIQQFDVIIRRLVYNQYKERNNKTLIKYMSVLQSITSAQYMMMNIKGGFANVNLGESSIMTEVWAKEFMDKSAWLKGKSLYASGLMDYFRCAWGERPNTLAGQLIEFFDVVDYDSNRELAESSKSAYEAFRKFRNFQYSPQTAGEHEMQNSAMFAMMDSHRLVEDPLQRKFGRPTYRLMTFGEYVRDMREGALLSVLTDEQKAQYEQLKEKIKADANLARPYEHFRKDLATTLITQGNGITTEQQRQFVRELKRVEEKAQEEYAKNPTLMEQFERSNDGHLAFKDGSLLQELDAITDADGVTQAYQLLGVFREKVISVNQYIHGIYDKVGRAQVEKTWIGSLLMQYHKHLPIGIMKWYRTEGMYNEERGTVMKGINTSLWDFLSLNFKKDKALLGINDESVTALESVQGILKGAVELATKANLYYHLLPEYDKANIRRAMATTCIVLGTIAATIALRVGWDNEDNLLYNLALYETDRLATEASQYFPITAWGEARKLYKSPVAAGSGITDLLSSANMIAHMIIDGEDFDGTYKSGKFAGENKLKVYIQRRIPIYRGLKSSLVDIKDNNQFYKVSENVLGFVNAAAIAEELKK